MNIYEIEKKQKGNPYFFSKDSLKFFGQTMESFDVELQPDGRYKISAPMMDNERYMGETVRYYNPTTRYLDRA